MLIGTVSECAAHGSDNDPTFVVKPHGVTENEDVLKTLSRALNNLLEVAIG